MRAHKNAAVERSPARTQPCRGRAAQASERYRFRPNLRWQIAENSQATVFCSTICLTVSCGAVVRVVQRSAMYVCWSAPRPFKCLKFVHLFSDKRAAAGKSSRSESSPAIERLKKGDKERVGPYTGGFQRWKVRSRRHSPTVVTRGRFRNRLPRSTKQTLFQVSLICLSRPQRIQAVACLPL
jgi:hypothetical protein